MSRAVNVVLLCLGIAALTSGCMMPMYKMPHGFSSTYRRHLFNDGSRAVVVSKPIQPVDPPDGTAPQSEASGPMDEPALLDDMPAHPIEPNMGVLPIPDATPDSEAAPVPGDIAPLPGEIAPSPDNTPPAPAVVAPKPTGDGSADPSTLADPPREDGSRRRINPGESDESPAPDGPGEPAALQPNTAMRSLFPGLIDQFSRRLTRR